MKKIIALSLSLAALAPASAFAQAPALRASVQAEAQASTSIRAHKAIPAAKNIASTTRAGAKNAVWAASEQVRAKVEAVKSLIERKRVDMQKRADGARSKARERFGARVEGLVGRVSDRLAGASAKLASIADRIDAHIDAQAGKGHDMSGSTEMLATARADISAANDKILAANAALETAMASETPKAGIPAVRAAVKAAESALALAKSDLIKALRAANAEAGITAGSN